MMTAARRTEGVSSIDSARELRRAALRLVARRDRSLGELKTRLGEQGFDPAGVEEICAWLVSRGLVDERQMAERLVERAKMDRHLGRRGTRAWLLRHRIDDETIGNAIVAYSLEDERAVARRLLQKRGGDASKPKERARLRRFLLGRGFHPETVAAVLRETGEQNG